MELHKKHIQAAAFLQPQAWALSTNKPVGVGVPSSPCPDPHDEQPRAAKLQDLGSQTRHKAPGQRQNSKDERRAQDLGGKRAMSQQASSSWRLLHVRAQAGARVQRGERAG